VQIFLSAFPQLREFPQTIFSQIPTLGFIQKHFFFFSQRWEISKNIFSSNPNVGISSKTVFLHFPTLGFLQKQFFVKSQRWEISKNDFSSNPNVGTSSKTIFLHFPTLGLIYNPNCHVKNQEYDKNFINHLKPVAHEKIKKQYTRVKQNLSVNMFIHRINLSHLKIISLKI
jgi:hypothetical protein